MLLSLSLSLSRVVHFDTARLLLLLLLLDFFFSFSYSSTPRILFSSLSLFLRAGSFFVPFFRRPRTQNLLLFVSPLSAFFSFFFFFVRVLLFMMGGFVCSFDARAFFFKKKQYHIYLPQRQTARGESARHTQNAHKNARMK